MQISHGIDGLRQLPPRCVLSVGNFDGVHRGHQHIIASMRCVNADLQGAGLAIATFEPHPLTVLRPELAPPRLSTPGVKRELLAAAGVDHLVVLPPTTDILNLTAEAFWAILRDEVRPVGMVEGSSFNFGKGRGGTIERLRQWTVGTAIQLQVVEAVEVALTDLSLVAVSSSILRWLIGHGRVRDAAIGLGRPYVLVGEVVQGYQRGRTIGVPTANLRCDEQMIPLEGVYAGRCTVDGTTYPAAVSIGTMPTFGDNRQQIEAHLLGFTGDLYGQTLSLEFLDWLREQRQYPSVDLLKRQLARDVQATHQRATLDPARPIAQAI